MSEKDRAAIVTFGNEAKIVRDYTQSSQEIAETVNNISNSDGRTMLYGGLEKALELIERTDVGIPKRKVVILLTDGINEYGGTTEDEIVQKFKEKTIPVYSVWNPGTRGSGAVFFTGCFLGVVPSPPTFSTVALATRSRLTSSSFRRRTEYSRRTVSS